MYDHLEIEWLGRIDYGAAWDLQKELVAARTADPDLPHKLLLLEHPPTYTLGRSGDDANLLLDEASRAAKGVALYRVDRGGDITYHGPGQLLAYPILYLERLYGRGIGRIRRYVGDLETVLIQTLAAFEIPARRVEGLRGVWVDQEDAVNKIAAIGVHVNKSGVSSHGIALNASTDLAYFQGIVPCGITDHGVTSMSAFLGRPVTVEDVLPVYSQAFVSHFGLIAQQEGMQYAHR
jgi:lipoyl(octanoyl) transferase